MKPIQPILLAAIAALSVATLSTGAVAQSSTPSGPPLVIIAEDVEGTPLATRPPPVIILDEPTAAFPVTPSQPSAFGTGPQTPSAALLLPAVQAAREAAN